MTIKEKLILMDEMEKLNQIRVRDFLKSTECYGCKVACIHDGEIRHITGNWSSIDEMREDLLRDGYVVLSYWKEMR